MSQNSTTQTPAEGRLMSLDALRGFDMLFIIGLSSLIAAICALFPGGDECWLARQMSHVSWEGFRHHDTIFALFLFISGMTFPFSLAKKRDRGWANGKIVLDILRRMCVLILLGLVYQGIFQFDFANLRIPSVLGRIGVAWAVAALIYCFTGRKTQWGIVGAILAGYFLLLKFTLAPDAPAGADSFSREGNIAYYIDRIISTDHIYWKGVGDPEGIVGTVSAVVTALLGMFTGRYVKESKDSGNRKTVKLLLAAAALLAVGLVWSIWYPVIKNLWTGTFVLIAAAYSVAMFAIFYYCIDVRGWRKGVTFFNVVGMNSITIYIGQAIIGFTAIARFFLGGLVSVCPPAVGEVIIRAGHLGVAWLFLYFLYRHKCFLKV
jgi:predicted acyltransferase